MGVQVRKSALIEITGSLVNNLQIPMTTLISETYNRMPQVKSRCWGVSLKNENIQNQKYAAEFENKTAVLITFPSWGKTLDIHSLKEERFIFTQFQFMVNVSKAETPWKRVMVQET